MAKFQFVKGTTSQTVLIFIQDSSSTTGAGLTGLTSASSGLTAYYYREGQGTGATAITLAATGSLGTWESGGFFQVDSTNMPGWYELGIPNAALATGADFVGIQLKGATNMAQCNLEIQLTGIDVNDATDGGMASVADWTDGGRLDLLIDAIKAKTDSLTFTVAGDVDCNIQSIGGVALNTSSAQIGVNLVNIGGAAVPAASGVLQVNTTQISGDSTAADNLEAALDGTGGVTITAAITGNITGNLSGSVGSVTGNVGGNVVGTVASVVTKTGYSLASTGLDLVVPADPSAIPVLGTTDIVGWIGYFGAWTVNEINSDSNSVDLRNSADTANLASHPTSDDGTTFISGEPT